MTNKKIKKFLSTLQGLELKQKRYKVMYTIYYIYIYMITYICSYIQSWKHVFCFIGHAKSGEI